MAEAWALYIRLQQAVSLNIKKIEIELDCKTLHNILLGCINHTHPIAIIVENCRFLLHSFEDNKICKISRSQNMCADFLAKEARKRRLPMGNYNVALLFVKNQYEYDLYCSNH